MDQGAVGVGVAPSLALAHMFVKKKKRSKKKSWTSLPGRPRLIRARDQIEKIRWRRC